MVVRQVWAGVVSYRWVMVDNQVSVVPGIQKWALVVIEVGNGHYTEVGGSCYTQVGNVCAWSPKWSKTRCHTFPLTTDKQHGQRHSCGGRAPPGPGALGLAEMGAIYGREADGAQGQGTGPALLWALVGSKLHGKVVAWSDAGTRQHLPLCWGSPTRCGGEHGLWGIWTHPGFRDESCFWKQRFRAYLPGTGKIWHLMSFQGPPN